jgi:DNA polymerase III delta prime subunit
VSATVGNVREVLARARERLGAEGRRTILFLDEIHRFNKAQQDALLPGVESGLVTLIGATTENPYYEVNSALISRTQVYELEPLSDEELAEIVRRGAAELGVEPGDEIAALVARRSGGDARTALNILELAAETAQAEGSALTVAHVEDAARKPPLVYDKAGDAHYNFTSAFIKSMRGGDADAAVYYLAAMLEGGEDARFIARRMIVLASEDIGNADPRALLVAVAAAQAVEHVGLPEARLNLSQAAVYRARRSRTSYGAEPGDGGRGSEERPAAGTLRRLLVAAARRRATSTRTTTRAASRQLRPEELEGRRLRAFGLGEESGEASRSSSAMAGVGPGLGSSGRQSRWCGLGVLSPGSDVRATARSPCLLIMIQAHRRAESRRAVRRRAVRARLESSATPGR